MIPKNFLQTKFVGSRGNCDLKKRTFLQLPSSTNLEEFEGEGNQLLSSELGGIHV